MGAQAGTGSTWAAVAVLVSICSNSSAWPRCAGSNTACACCCSVVAHAHDSLYQPTVTSHQQILHFRLLLLLTLLQAWMVLAAWLLAAVRHPRVYHQHRTLFVLVFKSALALAVVHLTNDGGRLISSAREVPTSKMLLVQATSLHGLVHLPALCVGLPLPFWLQLGWVLARTAMFMLGGASRGGWSCDLCGFDTVLQAFSLLVGQACS